jgi:hypothetical protein
MADTAPQHFLGESGRASLKRKFLFICGCPRSGTTALMSFLCRHPDIALGLERFQMRARRHELSPQDFELIRFFDVRPGDTWYDSLEQFSWHYDTIRRKYASARYVGDKIPYLYYYLDFIASHFEGARILFLLRNINEVALSYEARIGTFHWSSKYNAVRAVKDWNDSLDAGLRWVRRDCFFVVLYEEFAAGTLNLHHLCDFLALPSGSLDAAYQSILAESKYRGAQSCPVEMVRGARLDAFETLKRFRSQRLVGTGLDE